MMGTQKYITKVRDKRFRHLNLFYEEKKKDIKYGKKGFC